MRDFMSMNWKKLSNEYLKQEIARLRSHMENCMACSSGELPSLPLPIPSIPRQFDGYPVALEALCEAFELSELEKNILVLCAAAEIDFASCQLLGEISGNSQMALPTLHLVASLFPDLEINIDDRHLPLFQWNLVQSIGTSQVSLITAPLKIDPWVLHFILGHTHRHDPKFPAVLEPTPFYSSDKPLSDSYEAIVSYIDQQWQSSQSIHAMQLCGIDSKAHQFIAAAVCSRFGYLLKCLNASALEQNSELISSWVGHWKRYARLYRQILLIELNSSTIANPSIQSAIAEIIASCETPIFLSVPERWRVFDASLEIDIPDLSFSEQKEQWEYHLGHHAVALNGQLGGIVTQFNLNLSAIEKISKSTIVQLEIEQHRAEPQPLSKILWQCCRSESRTFLEGLVERIEPKTTWDDLILPPDAQEVLKKIISTARHRAKVYDEWGMGGNTHRGMGLTSLFHGPSGTGKTTAAEIIAHELYLDLYRVDLSQVSSKYIGETEKSLRKVFDAAQQAGAVLLFDEADSIIGKRSDVKDARDKYANQEVGFLLQEMEKYSGLAILTTNLPNALDSAFMRRIRASVRFEYPNAEQRAKIWYNCFPKTAPTQDLSYIRLAQVNFSGANIRNAAEGGAFNAAEEGELIQMKHLLKAVRAECLKISRPLTDDEIRGWGV
jgi:ATPase family associated with various cellular activities (AAA)